MKKLMRFLSLSLMFTMLFSMTAFAKDAGELTVEKNLRKNVTDLVAADTLVSPEDETSVMPYGPAPQVSSVQVAQPYIENGHLMVPVVVAGYGTPTATLNERAVTKYTTQMIGKPIVTGFVYTFDCGVATVGTHRFYVSVRSTNFPNTVKTDLEFITVSQN